MRSVLKNRGFVGLWMVAGAIIGAGFHPGDAHGGFNAPTGTCYLTERLKDSVARYEFVGRVVRLEQDNGANTYSDGRYRIVNAGYTETDTGSSAMLDPISNECISCHDGSTGPMTGSSHPIGVRYPAFSRDGHYVPKRALNRRIILIDGQIGCLSCHNPLNPERFHLVMSNDRSRLCFACHIN